MESNVVRRTGRSIRPPSLFLPTTPSPESRPALAKGRSSSPGYSRLQRHHHEPRRQLRHRRNRQCRSPRSRAPCRGSRHEPRLHSQHEISRRIGSANSELDEGVHPCAKLKTPREAAGVFSVITTEATRLFLAHVFCGPGRAVEGPWQYASPTKVDETRPTAQPGCNAGRARLSCKSGFVVRYRPTARRTYGHNLYSQRKAPDRRCQS